MTSVLRALLLGSIVLAATAARATPSRVLGLGDLGRYVEDDSNVLMYPGLLPKYSHFVYVDLAGPGGISPTLNETQQGLLNGGAFIRLSDGLHLGIVASSFAPGEHAAFLGQVAANANAGNKGAFASLVPTAALRRYDLILGYGDKTFGAGLRFAYGSVNDTYVPGKSEKTDAPASASRDTDYSGQSQLRLAAGVSGQLPDGSGYDGAIDYSYYGVSYQKNLDEAFIGGGGHGVGVNGRFRFVLSRFWDLIPQVGYRFTTFGLLEDQNVPAFGAAGTAEIKRLENKETHIHARTGHMLDVGAVAALRASKVANFWVGTGVQYARTFSSHDVSIKPEGVAEFTRIDEATNALKSLPYIKFAFEATPLEWLKLRAAVEKYSWSTSSSTFTDQSEPEISNEIVETSASVASGAIPDFAAYVGATAFVNGFALDLLLDNEFLRRGPSFISGATGNIAMRASVSAKF